MIYWGAPQTISILKSELDQDRIILASGDTVLGLWGRVTSPVFEALNALKQRHDKPYLLVIGSLDKLENFIDQELSEQILNLIRTCWPGPVTLIFKARSDLPRWILSPNGTIALRIPDHSGLLELLQQYDGLFSTSANIHAKPIPESLALIDSIILNNVAAVCVEPHQLVYQQNPSTILDCSSGSIQVVRQGAFPSEILRDLLG